MPFVRQPFTRGTLRVAVDDIFWRFALIKTHESIDIFIGVDVGKSNHHAVAINPTGKKLVDRALPRDEANLRAIIKAVAGKGTVMLVVDQPGKYGLTVRVVRAHGTDPFGDTVLLAGECCFRSIAGVWITVWPVLSFAPIYPRQSAATQGTPGRGRRTSGQPGKASQADGKPWSAAGGP